ncbi:MAG TPA: ABC transporter substrate-binding protein [Acidimicrobiales bacterium]|nr:ABC transporter substrate-binding protein [Acidimicrobiales bacterium]
MRTTRHRPRPAWVVVVIAAIALVAGACGDDTAVDDTAATSDGAASTLAAVDAERCAANQAAGEILFLTSFDFAAAASIIDVVVAEDQGWFDDLCLDVTLQAGFSTANVAAVAANQAQMTSFGSFSEVAVANAAEAELVAVGVYGNTSVEALLVEADSDITELAQVTDAPMGIKGAIPFSVRAMLAQAGVDEDEITQIEVDFNPVTLFETEIESLPVYKSNEPGQLDAQGYEYRVFDPADFDIPASFGVFVTSQGFAEDHPTAVADFLRASLRGFAWAADNPAEAVDITLGLSDPDFFFAPEGETFRWETERDLVLSSTPEGAPVGGLVADQLAAEVAFLERLGVIEPGRVDVAASFDASFIEEIHDGDQLIWPLDG